MSALHKQYEQQKRREYGERVLQVEMGSFTPLVFTSSGGMAKECAKFYDRLADMLSEKRKEQKSKVTAWLRCRLSFSLLRSAILCLRGSRSLRTDHSFVRVEETDVDVAVGIGHISVQN